jgi:hypothetical protein
LSPHTITSDAYSGQNGAKRSTIFFLKFGDEENECEFFQQDGGTVHTVTSSMATLCYIFLGTESLIRRSLGSDRSPNLMSRDHYLWGYLTDVYTTTTTTTNNTANDLEEMIWHAELTLSYYELQMIFETQ